MDFNIIYQRLTWLLTKRKTQINELYDAAATDSFAVPDALLYFFQAIKSILWFIITPLWMFSSDKFLILIFEATNLNIKFTLKILILNDHFSIKLCCSDKSELKNL